MFARTFPRRCSRLTVFVSYAREQCMLGEEIAQALKNAGHDVFFDLDSIPAGGDYNDRIRSAVMDADRMVFLASRASLAPGKFTLTEVQFAKERWPSPEARVFPVIVDATLKPSDLPVYFRSVSVLQVQGNATAEVVAAVEKSRKIGTFCKSVTALAAAALIGGAYIAAGPGLPALKADIALLAPQKIHFRSLIDAPLKADATAANPDWANTPMTITVMPVSFNHRTEPGLKARILEETVELSYAGTAAPFRGVYVVEITDAPCGERWYCIKGNVGPETLEPGRSISRETMFIPVALAGALKWGEFVDAVLSRPELPVSVTYRAKVERPDGSGVKIVEMNSACRIDTVQMRADLVAAKFKANDSSRPVFLEPECLPVQATAAASTATKKN